MATKTLTRPLDAGLPARLPGLTPVDPDAPTQRRRRAVDWVEAAPFRAHLLYLLGAGIVSLPMIACLADVPVRSLRRLLTGWGGRPIVRLSAETASRLLAVTMEDVRGVRYRMVNASDTTARLQCLHHHGTTVEDLALLCGIGAAHLGRLLSGRESRCTVLVALRVATHVPAAAAEALQTASPLAA